MLNPKTARGFIVVSLGLITVANDLTSQLANQLDGEREPLTLALHPFPTPSSLLVCLSISDP
jgi:hypothetical protein